MRLERAADGTIAGGEWAFTVSYTEIVASAPPPDGGEDDPGEMLVQRRSPGSYRGKSGQPTADSKRLPAFSWC